MSAKQLLHSTIERVALRAILLEERVRSGVTFFPMGDDFYADPYMPYRKLREKDPVHHSRLINGWILTRYADVDAALRDPAKFSSDERKQLGWEKARARAMERGIIDETDSETFSMLRIDPPDHTRLRSLVSRAFTPRTVEGLRARIEHVIDEHLDAVAGQGGMDVIASLAYPLPVIIVAEMLGIPPEDHAKFKVWSDEAIRGMGVSTDEDDRAARRAQRELRAYFEAVVTERRREPREDLLSAMIAAEEGGERLTADELYETCELLLIAGHETTTNLIGNGLLALLQHPDQFDLLRCEPERIEHATEELLRYDSPVQATTRIISEDMTFAGRKVKAGEQLALLIGAANRDPAQFPDPDRLDVTREDVKHVGFGHGIHFCLGAPLARIEAPAAFRAMLERFPNMKLDNTVTLKYKANVILRGLEQLPVRF